jgi:hypothetical protein
MIDSLEVQVPFPSRWGRSDREAQGRRREAGSGGGIVFFEGAAGREAEAAHDKDNGIGDRPVGWIERELMKRWLRLRGLVTDGLPAAENYLTDGGCDLLRADPPSLGKNFNLREPVIPAA